MVSYMAVQVQGVVGELHLEKRQRLLHPVTSQSRGVWVHVGPTWRLRLCLPRDLPLLILPLQRHKGCKVTKCVTWGHVWLIRSLHEAWNNLFSPCNDVCNARELVVDENFFVGRIYCKVHIVYNAQRGWENSVSTNSQPKAPNALLQHSPFRVCTAL